MEEDGKMITRDEIIKYSNTSGADRKNAIRIQKILKVIFWEVDMPNQIIYFSEGFQPIFNDEFYSNGNSIKNLIKLIYTEDLESVMEQFHKFTSIV